MCVFLVNMVYCPLLSWRSYFLQVLDPLVTVRRMRVRSNSLPRVASKLGGYCGRKNLKERLLRDINLIRSGCFINRHGKKSIQNCIWPKRTFSVKKSIIVLLRKTPNKAGK